MDIGWPERTQAVRQAAGRLCRQLGWAPLHEVALPNGRRADILALRPDGYFVCVEVKSGAADFMADSKWRSYQEYCDAFYFAVDADFPLELLPPDVGLMIAADRQGDLVRDPPERPMAPARRRALLQRFAMLGAFRLENMVDPVDEFALKSE